MQSNDTLLALIGTAWPDVPKVASLAESLGLGTWESDSRHFTRHDAAGLPVAHAGILSFTLHLYGKARPVRGVHAVCTHPSYRRRGLFTEVMQEAVRYCDTQVATTLLFTHSPELYLPFGFCVIAQHKWWAPLSTPSTPAPSSRAAPMRRLSHTVPADVALAQRLVSQRAPVSELLGVSDDWDLFAFNELFDSSGFARLYYAVDLDVMVVFESIAGTLRIYDIVGRVIPSFEDIIARLPCAYSRLEMLITPDLFSVPYLRVEPYVGSTALMVRGEWGLGDGAQIIFPPLAHC